MRRALLVALVLVAIPADASHTADDCGSGTDAPGAPLTGLPVALPLACDGALEPRELDEWDVFAVELTEGPVYARMSHDWVAGADHDICIINAAWTDGACTEGFGDEELALWWPAEHAFVAVVANGAGASYHLEVEQQDDCGTGVDALWEPAAPVATTYVSCSALLDVDVGDFEDAFLIPPPAVPDVIIVRVEPTFARAQLCVDDEVHQVGLRGRCTDSTFSRVMVARDPLRPMRVTVEAFGVDPVAYTLIVENAVDHPPRIPPLL